MSALIEPWSEEQQAAYDRKQAAALAEARDRFRLALVTAGVPVTEAGNVLAGLEEQGFRPRVRTGWGVLRDGMLHVEYGNPNGIRCDALELSQEWQPLQSPPDPPWVYCLPSEYHVVPGLEACTDPEHGEHRRTIPGGSMHRATPAEVEQLRAQREAG